ncbi:MAG: zinc ribbon domain-containing protein [Clostridiaceae bacterium]
MVCKECGSYNAENLSICKVCGAKLRDDDTIANSADDVNANEDGRPARDFVKPPAWPKSAFSGAPEKPMSTGSSESSLSSSTFRPTIPPRAAASAAPTCPHCGKPILSDAPFCAYCGQRVSGEVAPAAAPVAARPAAKPVPAPQQARAAYGANDFDDDEEDYDDEEDEEDYKPAKAGKRPAKLARRAKDDVDQYDDEDEEYDEEEYDEMPQKRGKGTTILFWGLIVLLLALIAVFGMYIAKKNFGGDVGKMFASIGTIFNKGNSDDVNATDPATTTDPASQMYTASISEYTDPSTNEVSYDIDIAAPTGSAIRIITDATLKQDTATVAANDRIILRIAREVFMPNAPVDSETLTIQPNIQAISPDGQTMQITVPPITVTVPTLSMTITEPAADSVNATFDNSPIAIMGQVNNYDSDIAVFVNDEQVYVDSTGMFTASYTPKQVAAALTMPTTAPVASVDPSATPDPAASPSASASPAASTSPDVTTSPAAEGEEAGETTEGTTTEAPVSEDPTAPTGSTETITIEARKNNCVTARKVITVQPYVVQTMSFTLGNDLKSLSSDTGTVTLTGTCTPGATITATSISPDVTFGQATVSETGTFTLPVTMAKVGAYDVNIVGKMTGYYDGTAATIVERPPTVSSSAFKKAAADIAKNMDKIKAGTTTSGDFVVTGRITEIISSDPYTIFRVQVAEGVEVIVYNRSAKSTINTSDIKDKKQIAGTLKGLYSDGTTPVLWGWFIWNK